MKLQVLTANIDEFLGCAGVADFAPNGLQVESDRVDIHKVACAVTASLEVVNQAAELGVDALIVHHGYFWKNENPVLTSMKYKRIRALIENNIALLAYHLPLDIHPQVGNNARLASILGVTITSTLKPDGKLPLLALGELSLPQDLYRFAAHCAQVFDQAPIVVEGGNQPIRKLAWCTGGAQDFIVEAKTAGADAYLSGEISERTFYQAKELGIHYLACGHHATERYGIQALGQWLQETHGISTVFINDQNPI